MQSSISTGEAAIHKTRLSTQLSSSSSSEDDDDDDDDHEEDTSLILRSENDSNNSGSSQSRDSDTPVNTDSENDNDDDEETCSTVSANEEFLSCGSSSSFEELKFRELQNAANDLQLLEAKREEDTELNNDCSQQRNTESYQRYANNNNRPCPLGKVGLIHKSKSISNVRDVK